VASLPRCSIWPANLDVVTLSSSDNKEVLELLFPSPNRDQFEDWPKANDTAASVYIALTTDASSSRTSAANAPRGKQGSRADGSSARWCRSRAAPP
jgi:hypothetical protein